MKSLLSIVASTVTFGFSVVLVGLLFGFPQSNYDYTENLQTTCSDQTCYNIERLIYQDISNGRVRDLDTLSLNSTNTDSLLFTQYTEFVNEYVDKSQSMDYSDLPSDFQNAWKRHMKAWRDYSNFLNKQNNSLQKMNNSEFNEYDKEFSLEINRTWSKTLCIGRSYGAGF